MPPLKKTFWPGLVCTRMNKTVLCQPPGGAVVGGIVTLEEGGIVAAVEGGIVDPSVGLAVVDVVVPGEVEEVGSGVTPGSFHTQLLLPAMASANIIHSYIYLCSLFW